MAKRELSREEAIRGYVKVAWPIVLRILQKNKSQNDQQTIQSANIKSA